MRAPAEAAAAAAADDDELEENALPEPFEWANVRPRPPIGSETVFTAAARGDVAALRGLIEIDGRAMNERDGFDAVPLYYACLCGHYDAVQYLLARGARCAVDTFDTARCHYASLTDDIRRLLRHYAASNRQRGPLLVFLFRIVNMASSLGRPDVVFMLPHDGTVIRAHRAVLSARCAVFAARFRGRWRGRTDIALVDPRLKGAALVAVVGYLYTERLLVAHGLLEHVAAIAVSLRLPQLEAFVRAAAASDVERDPSRRTHAVCADLGRDYVLGSLPLEIERDDDSNNVGELGLRAALWRRLVRRGVVPDAALADSRAANEDLDEQGAIVRGELWPPEGDTGEAAGESAVAADLHHDVELLVRGRALFRLHRCFVAGRSAFFDGLLAFGSADGDESKIRRFELNDISPFVMAIVLEYIYCDAVRPIPTASLALEALGVADSCLLNDGIKPLLVAQAARHLRLDTLCDIFSAASVYSHLKLSSAAAHFAAQELDAVLASDDFEELIRADADAVRGREDYDSVPILDDIRAEVRAGLPRRRGGAALTVRGAEAEAEAEAEVRRKLSLLDGLVTRLGLRLRR